MVICTIVSGAGDGLLAISYTAHEHELEIGDWRLARPKSYRQRFKGKSLILINLVCQGRGGDSLTWLDMAWRGVAQSAR